MTKKEERGYTVKGNLESLWEIFSAADMVLLVKALPNIGKNLVQLGKDVLENGIQFDTSLGIVAGGGEIWNLKNVGDDVAEEVIEKTVKREVAGETVEKTVKTEVSEEAVENTAKKEMADTTEDLSQKTVDKDDSSVIKGGDKLKISNESKEKWSKGSFDSVEDSLQYHFKEHGEEVGATNIDQYVRKAEGFSQNLRGAHKSYPPNGTPGAVRYTKNGKYIIIGPNGKILSFGLAR